MQTTPSPSTQERQRQQWLHALELTPWVATISLLGAAPSPLLELAESASDAVAPRRESPVAPPSASPFASKQAMPSAPQSFATAQPTPAKPVPLKPVSPAEKMPRLHLCQVEGTLIIVEQQDRQAPELGRDEQQLLQNLMRLFGQQSRRYPFLCPTQPEELREALTAFVKGLTAQGCQRVLLCLSEPSCRQLLADQPRLQTFALADRPALVLHSLDELLADPLPRKRRSWQLLCEAGFVV